MTIDELRQKLIAEDEAAYFVGGFGGAILEAETLKDPNCSVDQVVDIARLHGYQVTVVEEEPKQMKKTWERTYEDDE